jgi:hypothetical protein
MRRIHVDAMRVGYRMERMERKIFSNFIGIGGPFYLRLFTSKPNI